MGFIKIDRKIIHWEYFKNPAYISVWMYLLCRANFKDGESCGHIVHKGQVFETYGSIARNTGVSRDTVIYILKRMVSTQVVTLDSTHPLTHPFARDGILITIVNWDTYQSSEKSNPTGNPTGNTQGITSRNAQESEEVLHNKGFQKKKEAHPSDEKPKAKYKDWNEDWKYTDSRGNKYDWGYMVRNFGDNAENMARIIVDEDRKSRS